MTHTDNIDVGASLSEFIQKSALKEDGPQRHWIKAVYYHLFQARDGNPPKKELVLSFTDTPPTSGGRSWTSEVDETSNWKPPLLGSTRRSRTA